MRVQPLMAGSERGDCVVVDCSSQCGRFDFDSDRMGSVVLIQSSALVQTSFIPVGVGRVGTTMRM